MVEKITGEQLSSIEPKGTIVIKFFATWCGPCKMIAPQVESFAAENTDIRVYEIDVDQSPEIVSKFAIQGVPTIAVFKDGGLMSQKSGFMPKNVIENWVKSIS